MLRHGDWSLSFAEQGLVIYRRTDGVHRPLTVAVNCGRETRSVALDAPRTDLITKTRYAKEISLAPASAVILEG